MQRQERKKVTRSRLGCHRCKRLKVKCTEEKPACASCVKARVHCDYTLKLTWGGRPYKNAAKNQTSCPITYPSNKVSTSDSQTSHIRPNADRSTTLLFSAGGVESDDGTTDLRKSQTIMAMGASSPIQHQPSQQPNWRAMVNQEYESDIGKIHNVSPKPSHNYPADTRPLSGRIEPLLSNPEKISHSVADTSQIYTHDSAQLHSQNEIRPFAADLFFGHSEIPVVDTPQTDFSMRDIYSENCDDFSMDLVRIGRAFPSEPKSPHQSHLSPHQYSLDSQDHITNLLDSLHSYDQRSNGAASHKKTNTAVGRNLYSIPPSLVPLPHILLRVPYYRQLLHFWIDVAADKLVCAPYLYKDNPFKKILPQMAMHYPGLLTTLLAFAARARDDHEGSYGRHSKIVDQLLGRSCDELLRQLQDDSESTSDGTLATSLLLSSFEVVHSNDFNKHRAHATGASQIMRARLKKSRGSTAFIDFSTDVTQSQSSTSTNTRNESDIAFFLSRWFMYLDVIGSLSSTRDRGKYLRAFRNSRGYTPVKSLPEYHMSDLGREIDYLLGFDPELLPHFLNISLLIDEVQKYLSTDGIDSSNIPQFIVVAALELKDLFLKSYQAGESKRLSMFDTIIEKNGRFAHGKGRDLMHQDNILRSTNRLYYNNGLLNLYRRVLLLPRSSPLVQDLIREMIEIFELNIEPSSTAEICTIFCLFCAGCDNLDENKKDFFTKRLQNLVEEENMSAAKSLLIMDRCWRTGEDWITAANMLDIDLVLI